MEIQEKVLIRKSRKQKNIQNNINKVESCGLSLRKFEILYFLRIYF